MINSISFGSTFRVISRGENLSNKLKNNYKFEDFAREKDISVRTEQNYDKNGFSITTTVISPDNYDGLIENYCILNGIKYKKFDTAELLSLQSVKKRIKKAPKGHVVAFIDYDKLFKLSENQLSNIRYCKKIYDSYKDLKEQTDFNLKSGKQITPSTLYVNSLGNLDDTLNYIKKYGVNNLNTGSIYLDIAQKTSEPDHCMFEAMHQAGLNEIPVYVNKYSYKLCQTLGILK